MPLYEYTCTKCKHTEEFLTPLYSRKEAPKQTCPKCNKKTMVRELPSKISCPWIGTYDKHS